MVWQFDGSGELIDSIGRRGEGPGEFGSLDNIQSLGDTLYTFDASLQRLTAFPTSDGPRGSARTMSFRGRRGVVSAWVNPADRSIVYSAKAPIVTGWEVTQDRTTVHRAPGDALLVESYGDSLLHVPIDERLITVRPGVFGRGRLWVVLVTERDMIRRTDIGGRRYSYAPSDGGGRSLAVFDPESRTWRTGSLPVEGELVAVQNGQIYVLTTDELGVQFIRVFRIE